MGGLRAGHEPLPAIIWSCDENGLCTRLTAAWTHFTGNTPDNGLGWGFLQAVHPDDRQAIRTAFESARITKSTYQVEYRLLHKSGAHRWVLDTASPEEDQDGIFRGFMGAIVDNSARKLAEERLAERERELRLVTDTVPVLIAHVDNEQRYIYANSAYRTWYGVDPQTLSGKSIAELLGPDAYRERAPYIEAALRGERVAYDGSVTMHDGSVRQVQTVYVPNVCSAGMIEGFIVMVTDIDERFQAQEHLDLVVRELKHHMRNMMSLVQSIASQTFRGDAGASQSLEVFYGRLRALAAATDAITPQDVAASDLSSLVEKVVAPYRDNGHDPFALDGGSYELPTTAATSLSMALHELCTNAVKYGALSVPEGRVTVSWFETDTTLELHWVESKGPTVAPPKRQGFGTRLLQSALSSVSGARAVCEFPPSGVTCSFLIPKVKTA
ncbi:PAS domain S-box protein [Devosia sp. RR2S18]|jgi:PAS domain S-box-containing protein|uniref:PAS domain-containing sensor histidine kinase n=1 Tax=Devosia rhizosphaerae TaxID=3049774 RepID=UPI00253FA713|nr:PAS domain S-box protein [Devosia sp. RR2S18]WIJ24719.1 PAS domain S-box protein [Devosia sp. RR2S18]